MDLINKAIFKKTLSDALNLKRVLIYLVVVLLPQFLFVNVSKEAQMFSNLGMALKTEFLIGFFLIFAFVWVCGIAPAIMSSLICSSFVAQEEADGTLLMMVSKPIKRVSLLLSKFLAFSLSALMLSALSLFASIYLWASFFGLDFYSLFRVLSLFPILTFYSVFVSLIFGSMSAALSTMFSSRMKALVPMILILVLTFFVFIPIRGAARDAGVYESFMLDKIDLGYDLGNVFVGALEVVGTRLVPFVQMVVGTFTGTFVVPEGGLLIDYDHGFILQSLQMVTYHSLGHSFLKWVLIPLLLVGLGILIFNRRDIG
ncbi:MAG: ABC transporter permease subunit [Candidatus Altiarchaeota archaeon]|nr:ABC transporter permease subunit [Candidatus Altiarchaeota archaeon]